jgi:F-type H+-transporting ATPase subunit b
MATETHGAEEAAATGLPQLDVSTFPNLIFWLIVALVTIYLIVTRVVQPRIGGVLSERAGTITNDIATAEELKLKAKEAEAAYNQALADARAEAQRIAAGARAEIQADLDAATARADAEIAARAAESERRIGEIRDGALAAVQEVARDTAREIVAALGVSADETAVADAVAQRMKG